MAMNKLIIIFSLYLIELLSIRPFNNRTNNFLTKPISHSLINVCNIPAARKKNNSERLATNRLITFAKYLQSVGYYCRPASPIRNTNLDKSKLLTYDKFHFYQIPFSQNEVNSHRPISNHKTESEELQNWGLNLENFSCAHQIIQYRYYYGEKKSNSSSNIERRTSTHGFIEEWEFADSNAAKVASMELGVKQNYVYMNRGGFVCYKDNYMYVFYANASGFMGQTRHLFEKFLHDYQATKTNL